MHISSASSSDTSSASEMMATILNGTGAMMSSSSGIDASSDMSMMSMAQTLFKLMSSSSSEASSAGVMGIINKVKDMAKSATKIYATIKPIFNDEAGMLRPSPVQVVDASDWNVKNVDKITYTFFDTDDDISPIVFYAHSGVDNMYSCQSIRHLCKQLKIALFIYDPFNYGQSDEACADEIGSLSINALNGLSDIPEISQLATNVLFKSGREDFILSGRIAFEECLRITSDSRRIILMGNMMGCEAIVDIASRDAAVHRECDRMCNHPCSRVGDRSRIDSVHLFSPKSIVNMSSKLRVVDDIVERKTVLGEYVSPWRKTNIRGVSSVSSMKDDVYDGRRLRITGGRQLYLTNSPHQLYDDRDSRQLVTLPNTQSRQLTTTSTKPSTGTVSRRKENDRNKPWWMKSTYRSISDIKVKVSIWEALNTDLSEQRDGLDDMTVKVMSSFGVGNDHSAGKKLYMQLDSNGSYNSLLSKDDDTDMYSLLSARLGESKDCNKMLRMMIGMNEDVVFDINDTTTTIMSLPTTTMMGSLTTSLIASDAWVGHHIHDGDDDSSSLLPSKLLREVL